MERKLLRLFQVHVWQSYSNDNVAHKMGDVHKLILSLKTIFILKRRNPFQIKIIFLKKI
jgi:hypothetical protein